MKKEIRDLLSGIYFSEEGDLVLDIYKDDQGVHIKNVDLELDLTYHWTLTPEGKVITKLIDMIDQN